jgi:hypothetical protein
VEENSSSLDLGLGLRWNRSEPRGLCFFGCNDEDWVWVLARESLLQILLQIQEALLCKHSILP